MRLFRSPTKKPHLTSQMVYAVLGTVNPDTFTHARHECWTATPSINAFAELHPKQTVRVSFCSQTVIDEYCCLVKALDIGEYRYGTDFPLHHMEELAMEALVVDLHEIAMEDLKLVDYEYEWEMTWDEATNEDVLIATFVFKDKKDAERFKHHVKDLYFCVVEDAPLLD